MRVVKKTRVQKKHIVIISAFLAFVIALTASLVLTKLLENTGETESTLTESIEVLPGEGRQNGMPLAYPSITRKLQIDFVQIKNADGEFGLVHNDGDDYHTLYYVKDGKPIAYLPEIVNSDPNLKYTDLFAIETGDGIGQYSIVDYLCSAIQMPYFNQRIPFDTDPEKHALQLEEFGLTDETAKTIAVQYTDDYGKTVHRIIKIGDLGVVGTGYYFTVTDDGVERPYIYASLNNYFGYAESNITNFLKPLLISAGLNSNAGEEPFLTTGYYQWINTLYECTCGDKCTGGNCTDCGCESYLTDNASKVILYADTVEAITDPGSESSATSTDGYITIPSGLTEIDLSEYKKLLDELRDTDGFVPTIESRNYERMINLLAGRGLGKLGASISIYTADRLVDIEGGAVNYVYNVTAIESIITELGDITDVGASMGNDFDAVRVTYTATLDGKPVTAHPLHAVIDFRVANIDSAAEDAIRAARIGDELDITFSVSYSEENAVVKDGKFVITSVLEIYDAKGNPIDTVKSDSNVYFLASVMVNDKKVGETALFLDLADAEEGIQKKMKEKLLGKKIGQQTLEIDQYKACYEYMLGVTAYSFDSIEYFVKSELVSAFAFKSASLRDPYYGESLYDNLFPEGDHRRLYGLNAGVCETIVKMLGGLSDDENATSSAATGLSGDKVIAVGLTPDVMKKYGLYAYSIYYEVPRSITTYEPEDGYVLNGNIIDDHILSNELGFNLYISEVDPETNTRYIASDLYDVVTRVPAEDFVFLKYDFETFWARRNLILMNVQQIGAFGIEFCMEDLYGNYNFELTQVENSTAIHVHLTSEGECSPSKYTEYMANASYPKSEGGVSLKNLYLYMSNAPEEEHKASLPDSLGAAMFREAMLMFSFIHYVDILPDEVRDEAPSEDNLVMRMKLDVKRKSGLPATDYKNYVYEFYRIDDTRVRVAIHAVYENGDVASDTVSDFYISTYTFKKIVNTFVGILNAQIIDLTEDYPS